jgi:hypothetical protein
MNPYDPPAAPTLPLTGESQSARDAASQAVFGPALSLMIVSGLCLALLLVALPIDVYFLTSGAAARLPNRGIDPTVRITIRLAWGCLLFAASCLVFFGALQMMQLANYNVARLAAIVACIPCVGPCCLLGVPFGAWALKVLATPQVRSAFHG